MPLLATVDNGGGVEFWHKDPIGLNNGIVLEFTVTVNDAVVAHEPAKGVKV